jgi:predicted RNA binding protein YcfA (HicA-like mRNA interferase family)
MPRITPIPWKVFDCILLLAGYYFSRQKGGHRVYTRSGSIRPVILPVHSQDLHQDVIVTNIGTMGISCDEYFRLLKKCQ